jgi:hypothetical protein
VRPRLALLASLAAALLAVGLYEVATSAAAVQPATQFHYAPNGNFSGSTFTPGALGFNVADIGSRSEADSLPAGVVGLIYTDGCSGATAGLKSAVGTGADPKVFGVYLADEPSPGSCPPAQLRAASDWIHTNAPGVRTFIILLNEGPDSSPSYPDGYTPAGSHLDLYGLDPYPCRSDAEVLPCAYAEITNSVTAAKTAGIPIAQIVPVYQAFGGYSGGTWVLPTATQESTILDRWGAMVPTPVFDFAYSWGVQSGDIALVDAPADLRLVFAAHNGAPAPPPPTTTTTVATTTTTVASTTTTVASTTTTLPSTSTTLPSTSTTTTATTVLGTAPSRFTCPVILHPVVGQQVTCTFRK